MQCPDALFQAGNKLYHTELKFLLVLLFSFFWVITYPKTWKTLGSPGIKLQKYSHQTFYKLLLCQTKSSEAFKTLEESFQIFYFQPTCTSLSSQEKIKSERNSSLLLWWYTVSQILGCATEEMPKPLLPLIWCATKTNYISCLPLY